MRSLFAAGTLGDIADHEPASYGSIPAPMVDRYVLNRELSWGNQFINSVPERSRWLEPLQENIL